MDKQLAMELMVKCADITNVVKPATVARRWALRVTNEFFLQGDAERAMGMDISTGFIDYLARPLFTAPGRAWTFRSRSCGTTARSTPSAPTLTSRRRARRRQPAGSRPSALPAACRVAVLRRGSKEVSYLRLLDFCITHL